MKNTDSKFISGKSYNDEVKSLLESEGNVDISIAFVGSGASSWFCGQKTAYRMIVNLASGATNPSEIKEIKRKNCEIRQLDNLHAKVFISKERTIVGSANLSANGLGLEGSETAGWEEAGIVTSTSICINQWFDKMWEQARKISKEDLIKAHEKWDQRNKNRPVLIKHDNVDFLKNRNIGLIVSWVNIDPKTKKESDNKFKDDDVNSGLKINKDFYRYQDYDINQKYIYFDYWITNRGAGNLVCNGVALPMNPKRKYDDVEYLLHDDKAIHHGIHLKKYQSQITKLLKTYLKEIELPKDEGGILIELDDILGDG